MLYKKTYTGNVLSAGIFDTGYEANAEDASNGINIASDKVTIMAIEGNGDDVRILLNDENIKALGIKVLHCKSKEVFSEGRGISEQ